MPRMLGGSLMVAAGIGYLLFEDKMIADLSGSKRQSRSNHISRSLIGVQVSL